MTNDQIKNQVLDENSDQNWKKTQSDKEAREQENANNMEEHNFKLENYFTRKLDFLRNSYSEITYSYYSFEILLNTMERDMQIVNSNKQKLENEIEKEKELMEKAYKLFEKHINTNGWWYFENVKNNIEKVIISCIEFNKLLNEMDLNNSDTFVKQLNKAFRDIGNKCAQIPTFESVKTTFSQQNGQPKKSGSTPVLIKEDIKDSNKQPNNSDKKEVNDKGCEDEETRKLAASFNRVNIVLSTDLKGKREVLEKKRQHNNNIKRENEQKLLQKKEQVSDEANALRESHRVKVEEKNREKKEEIGRMTLEHDEKNQDSFRKCMDKKNNIEQDMKILTDKFEKEYTNLDKNKHSVIRERMEKVEELNKKEQDELAKHAEDMRKREKEIHELEMEKINSMKALLSKESKNKEEKKQKLINDWKKAEKEKIENQLSTSIQELAIMVRTTNTHLLKGEPFSNCLDQEESKVLAKEHMHQWNKGYWKIQKKVDDLQKIVVTANVIDQSFHNKVTNALTELGKEYNSLDTIPGLFELALEDRNEQEIKCIANKLSEHSKKINQWVDNSNSVSKYAIQNQSQQNAIENQPQQ